MNKTLLAAGAILVVAFLLYTYNDQIDAYLLPKNTAQTQSTNIIQPLQPSSTLSPEIKPSQSPPVNPAYR